MTSLMKSADCAVQTRCLYKCEEEHLLQSFPSTGTKTLDSVNLEDATGVNVLLTPVVA